MLLMKIEMEVREANTVTNIYGHTTAGRVG